MVILCVLPISVELFVRFRYKEKEFQEQKGDPTWQWLLGLDHIHTKLGNLLTLNKLIADQPWKIQADVYEVCMYNV